MIWGLAATDEAKYAAYRRSLFAQSEAQAGACAARGGIFGAAIAAGLMVHQLTRWLRRLTVDRDTVLNLTAGEWTVSD